MAVAASETAFDEAVEYALGELQLSHLKLKEKQLAVLERVYNGKDVFGWLPKSWLPTSYGKSICCCHSHSYLIISWGNAVETS